MIRIFEVKLTVEGALVTTHAWNSSETSVDQCVLTISQKARSRFHEFDLGYFAKGLKIKGRGPVLLWRDLQWISVKHKQTQLKGKEKRSRIKIRFSFRLSFAN